MNTILKVPTWIVPVAGDIARPLPGATGAFTTIFVVVRGVAVAWTVMVDATVGPVSVAQVTAPATTGVAKSVFAACMLPAHRVSASNPPRAWAVRFLNTDELKTDKSMEDLPFLEGFLHDIAGRRSIFQSLQSLSAD